MTPSISSCTEHKSFSVAALSSNSRPRHSGRPFYPDFPTPKSVLTLVDERAIQSLRNSSPIPGHPIYPNDIQFLGCSKHSKRASTGGSPSPSASERRVSAVVALGMSQLRSTGEYNFSASRCRGLGGTCLRRGRDLGLRRGDRRFPWRNTSTCCLQPSCLVYLLPPPSTPWRLSLRLCSTHRFRSSRSSPWQADPSFLSRNVSGTEPGCG
jgi:hypothetical protein